MFSPDGGANSAEIQLRDFRGHSEEGEDRGKEGRHGKGQGWKERDKQRPTQ